MRRLVVQRHLRRPGTADAVRAHAAQFSWDRAADAYLALYSRLLGLGDVANTPAIAAAGAGTAAPADPSAAAPA